MFEKFTEKARQIILQAREEAIELGHTYLGSEHILLSLIREDDIPSLILSRFGLTPEKVRKAIMGQITRGSHYNPYLHTPHNSPQAP